MGRGEGSWLLSGERGGMPNLQREALPDRVRQQMLPWQKSMRRINCESEKGQGSDVEKKGEISETLKFTWQKARPSGCPVRGTSSASSKEDLSQETLTADPDGVACNSLPSLYMEQTRSWSTYCQGSRTGCWVAKRFLFCRFLKFCTLSWRKQPWSGTCPLYSHVCVPAA